MKLQPKHLARFILALIALLIIASLTSCKPSLCKARRQYNKLTEMYPELVEFDTVVVRDTIIKTTRVPVPEYRDSFIFKHDTTYETKEVIIYKKGDRVYLRVKPDTVEFRDTIPFEVQVPGKVVTTNEVPKWAMVLSGIALTFLILIIVRVLVLVVFGK